MLCSFAFFQFLSTYPLYLKDQYLLDEFHIGLLFAVNTVIIVIFEMLLVEYVKRWQMLLLIGWGNFFTCLGFGLLPLSNLMWVLRLVDGRHDRWRNALHAAIDKLGIETQRRI